VTANQHQRTGKKNEDVNKEENNDKRRGKEKKEKN
jgi:hypothetical protein